MSARTHATSYLAVLQHQRGVSAHTLRAYTREVQAFVEYLGEQLGDDVPMSSVEHLHIRGYLARLYDRGLTRSSTARALSAIRSWFKWLAKEGHVEANPARLVGSPRLPTCGVPPVDTPAGLYAKKVLSMVVKGIELVGSKLKV